VITAGILASGFSQFKAGNKKASQFFMRARVVAQVLDVSPATLHVTCDDSTRCCSLLQL